MGKKLFTSLVCFLLCLDLFGQRIEKDAFVAPDKQSIGYDIFSFTDFTISTFVIIIPADQADKDYLTTLLKRQKGLEKFRVQFYLPDAALGTGNVEKQKQNFAGLLNYLTGRKKLIDASLFIIAPQGKDFLSEHYLSLVNSDNPKYNKPHKPKGTITLEKGAKITDKYLLDLLKKNRNTYP